MSRALLILLAALITVAVASPPAAAQGIKTKRNYIRVDQFGYTPDMPKVAVIADAVNGFNSAYGINLNANVNVTLRRNSDGSIVKSARATAWNGGATDGLAGDKGWWFDFSDVTAEGTYYIQVTENGGNTVNSNRFRIADDVYASVLKRAVQMFYYQRCNFNKTSAYAAGGNWTDGPWYDRSNQDVNAYFLNDNNQRKDMRGGWIDAGDPNKYVNFAAPVVHNLLTTYRQHPDFWDGFTLDIPESGNGVADLLDEIKYEIDWIRRMQASNGGVHNKVGILNDYRFYSPPSTDTRNRYYEQLCPSSSVMAAGMLAHAAAIFEDAGVFTGEIAGIRADAEAAWNYYQNSSNKSQDCDGGEIEAGDGDGPGGHYSSEHQAEAAVAAVYLYELTGKSVYHDYFKNNYTRLRPFVMGSTSAEWSIYRANQGEAAMNYTRLSNIDAGVRDAIIGLKTSSAKSSGAYYSVQESENLYRARPFYFNWGSNSLLSREAYHNYDFINYDLKSGSHANYLARSAGIINYMHGVNPFGMVYLTNMYGDGAELSADEIYHTWFYANTRFDNINGDNVGPPPGFLQGGANPSGGYLTMKIGTDVFSGVYANDQPNQKAFSVSNEGVSAPGGGYEAPYAYNEPAIYYQASYVKALANFVAGSTTAPPPPALEDDIASSSQPGQVTVGSTVNVSVAYEAEANRDVLVYLESNGSPWTRYASARQQVSAGSGTVTLNVSIPSDLATGTDRYKWQTILTTRGGDWGNKFDNIARTNVDAVAPAPPPPPTTTTRNIYTDNLQNSWANWSWGGTATVQDGLANNGSYAFKYNFNSGGGAVSFQHPNGFTTDDLVSLTFFARTWSSNRTFDISSSYDDNYGNRGPQTRVTVTPTYQQFTITKAQLGTAGWIKRIFMADGGSETIFLDNVKLNYSSGTSLQAPQADPAAATHRLDVQSLTAVPNPADERIMLTYVFEGEHLDEVRIELYGLTGKLLYSRRAATADGSRGAEAVDLHALNLAPGLYVARVRSEDGSRALSTRIAIR